MSFGTSLKALVGPEKAGGGRGRLVDEGVRARTADPFWFVRALSPAISHHRAMGSVVLVDDLRYLREATWLVSAGFALVRVDAPLGVRGRRLRDRGEDPWFAASDHPSEQELDHYAGFTAKVMTREYDVWPLLDLLAKK